MDDQLQADHVRTLDSFLAIPEKRALEYMAKRLPRWVNSDHLTLIGLVSMLAAGAAYWAATWNRFSLLLVVLALAVNWFGDSLDGTLARVRNAQRPRYGFYVDHVTDIVGATALFAGLAVSPYMSPIVALALLAAYLMMSAEVFLSTHVRAVFQLSFLRIGPTELRILLAFGTLYLLHKPFVVLGGTEYRLFDVGGVIAAFAMTVTFVVSAIRNTWALYKAEPLPR